MYFFETSIGSLNGTFSLAVAVGLMLSPESLVLLGNSMGRVGLSFLGFILLAASLRSRGR